MTTADMSSDDFARALAHLWGDARGEASNTTAVAQPLRVMTSDPAACFSYFGDREGWYVVLAQTRDSDPLDESNFRVIRRDMETRFGDSVAVESCHHFACGWVEYLLVDPTNADAVDAAIEWRDRLADYPVADEEDYSACEEEHTDHITIDAAGTVTSSKFYCMVFAGETLTFIARNDVPWDARCCLCDNTYVERGVYSYTDRWERVSYCCADHVTVEDADDGIN